MTPSTPHFLLFSHQVDDADPGRWRFVLRASDGARRMEADDVEPDARGERLELLTVVRGLEALEQPSRVTLVTSSIYVREGIRHGLTEWRKNGWQWERFGQMVPVKNMDLWQRVERAMQFHQVDCRAYRIDPPHQESEVLAGPSAVPEAPTPNAPTGRQCLQFRVPEFARRAGDALATSLREMRRSVVRWCSGWIPTM